MRDDRNYRNKAEALLSRAAAAENMAERGRLIDEAMYWHMLALDMGASAREDDEESPRLHDRRP